MKKHIILIMLLAFFGLTCYLMLTFSAYSFFSGFIFGSLLSASKRYEYNFEKKYKKIMHKIFMH